MYENKTVLVTGATGLIGSHIIERLMRLDNVRVIALSRSEEKLKIGFSKYLNNSHFRIIAGNVQENLEIDEKVDYIFHAASPMEGKVIRNKPLDVINPNIQGTINCLELLKKQKEKKEISGRMILFSSVTVYGNATKEDVVVTEEDTNITEKLEALSAPYSQSKRMSEVIALAYYRQFEIDVVIGRFSTVYGYTRFIPDTAFFEFIKKGIAHENIILNSAGLPRRDNIYIDDAVEAALLIGKVGKSGESYNISSNGDLGNYVAVDEIANMVAEIVNSDSDADDIQVIFRNENDNKRGYGIKLDNNKLKKLGWCPTISLTEGIQRTLRDLKKSSC